MRGKMEGETEDGVTGRHDLKTLIAYETILVTSGEISAVAG